MRGNMRDYPTGPQPEGCELCGTLVEGSDLIESQAEGLEGLRICSSNDCCARVRFGLRADERQPEVFPSIGQGRVWPPGGPLPWEPVE